MQPSEARCITVIGAGSWGTALATLLARKGLRTLLWGHEPEHVARLRRERCNSEFLPDIPFPDGLEPVTDLPAALAPARDVLVAVPSHAFREVLTRLRPHLAPAARVLWATKGLELGSGKLMHQVVAEVLGERRPCGVISGPTFAREVAKGLPTAATIASADPAFAADMAEILHTDSFRSYTSDDVVGVQLGGAVKNVLAIAAGISDGLGFGANARAALITRGLAEIFRLGQAMGGRQETFMGLAGLGDLVLTCTDDQSRNRRFGLALARGQSQEQAHTAIGQVVEGVQTARVVVDLAREHTVEMPITEQVFKVLYQALDPRDAVAALFARELKAEFG
ncbi:MAG: NAD(P)H-dependent glycerol-3-phosphate dehydrogenase [Gammaproteobacteria bacterium]